MTKNYLLLASALALPTVFVYSGASAQNNEKPTRFADFTEPFTDPDGSTVQSLAKLEGISVDAARTRLKATSELSRAAYSLQKRYPDAFAGLKIETGNGQKAVLYTVDGKDAAIRAEAQSLSSAFTGGTGFTIQSTTLSQKELNSKAEELVARFGLRSMDVVVASDFTTSKQSILARDPSAIIRLLAGRQISLGSGTEIERSGGVTLTVSRVEGGWGFDGTGGSKCTLGFNVGQISGPLRGVTTAGHCTNGGRHNLFSPTVDLGFQQQWTNGGVDTQWHTFLGGPEYLVVPDFFTSGQILSVTGAQAATPGSYVCKQGITTARTCGYIDTRTVSDSYGTFPRLLTNSQYPTQSLEGDSGGPVFAGGLAVGMTHARMSNPPYHNVFTPLTSWQSRNLPIGVIAQQP